MRTLPLLCGLHHVTAITSNTRSNLDFYTRILGMRLVKKTVNQDDVSAYHFFYADALGTPGTELTFFDWKQMPSTRHGAGLITETALRVSGGIDSLKRWASWFDGEGVSHGPIQGEGEFPCLPFQDGEGQRLRLVAEPTGSVPDRFHPWKESPVPIESAIGGLHSVTLTVKDFEPTARFLTEVLGFRLKSPDRFEVGDGGPGAQLELLTSPTPGMAAAGGVHHVAWGVNDSDQQRAWLQHLSQNQVLTSGIINRFYFQSLYFRIPGGILFEIATMGPGFTADGESLDHLGERLSLPPFLENLRPQIEAGLEPIS